MEYRNINPWKQRGQRMTRKQRKLLQEILAINDHGIIAEERCEFFPNKRKFLTEKTAELAASNGKRKFGKVARTYHCEFCGGFHNTTEYA